MILLNGLICHLGNDEWQRGDLKVDVELVIDGFLKIIDLVEKCELVRRIVGTLRIIFQLNSLEESFWSPFITRVDKLWCVKLNSLIHFSFDFCFEKKLMENFCKIIQIDHF